MTEQNKGMMQNNIYFELDDLASKRLQALSNLNLQYYDITSPLCGNNERYDLEVKRIDEKFNDLEKQLINPEE